MHVDIVICELHYARQCVFFPRTKGACTDAYRHGTPFVSKITLWPPICCDMEALRPCLNARTDLLSLLWQTLIDCR